MHVAFLMIAHLPYVRRAGRKPNGEDVLHALLAQGILPLIELLTDLNASGLQPRVALACSPLLSEQMADPVIQKHFVLWIETLLAHHETGLHEAEAHGDHHAAYLERFALEWGRQRLRTYEERLGRTPNQTLRALATARVIEPLAGAASYAYLPLLKREESVRAQIEHGTLHTTRHQGRPDGLWLPGCGWRPGLEQIAATVGLNYLVADPSSLPANQPATPALVGTSRIAVLFPDQPLAQAIWSEELGYPGDPLYRDPDDPRGYHARGGQPYDPYYALRRAQEHATHFVMTLVAAAERRPANDLALILLDATQLGPRWVEGITWLQAVLTLVATHNSLSLTTPGAYLRQHRPRRHVQLGPGSWAVGGHAGWQGAEAEAYWQAIHAAEARMVALAAAYPQAEGEQERLLTQAARELLLAQTSDWPALLSAGSNGAAHWRSYLERFEQLAALATQRQINAADRFLLEQLEERDGLFSSLNYRIFAP